MPLCRPIYHSLVVFYNVFSLYHLSQVRLMESEKQKDTKVDRMYFMTGSLPNYGDLSANFRCSQTIRHDFDFVLAFLDCLIINHVWLLCDTLERWTIQLKIKTLCAVRAFVIVMYDIFWLLRARCTPQTEIPINFSFRFSFVCFLLKCYTILSFISLNWIFCASSPTLCRCSFCILVNLICISFYNNLKKRKEKKTGGAKK